jgi:uncharacterized phage protein (TIGR01671 family)
MGEMREILFRGKTVCDGDWVYGGITWNPSRKKFFIHTDWEEAKVIPETVGQYTGLTDKNGTRVFENDIVTVYYNPKYVGVSKDRVGNFAVVFHDGCFMKRKITNPMSGDAGLYHFIQSDEFEVIGNIYDNPELLESDIHKT